MRQTIYLLTAALCLCGTYSCRQFLTEPHSLHHHDNGTISIDLIYPNADTTDYGSTFELIVSEPYGKVLLDTLAPYNAPIIAKMKTKMPLVDVSVILYSPTFNFYLAEVYKSVQPGQWTTIPGNSFPLNFPNAIAGTITYTNPPLVDWNTVHFSSLPTTSTVQPGVSSYNSSELDISYSGLAGKNIAYLILPTLNQYSYQTIQSVNDTISLSQMDSTVPVHFNMPPQYSLASSYMYGYLDTTDYTKYLLLYSYYQPLAQGDLQYPPRNKVPVQKYSYGVESTTQNNEFLAFRKFGVAAPVGTLNIPFPTTPIYTLNSTKNDSFSVSFAQAPTNYTTSWSVGNVTMVITTPPDSSQLRPLTLLTTLHSKLLQGQSLSGLALQNFGYETIPGLTYSAYFAHQTDPQQLLNNGFANDLLYLIFMQ